MKELSVFVKEAQLYKRASLTSWESGGTATQWEVQITRKRLDAGGQLYSAVAIFSDYHMVGEGDYLSDAPSLYDVCESLATEMRELLPHLVEGDRLDRFKSWSSGVVSCLSIKRSIEEFEGLLGHYEQLGLLFTPEEIEQMAECTTFQGEG